MDQDNTKAIVVLNKVVVKLQELIKELSTVEQPVAAPSAAVVTPPTTQNAPANAVAPAPEKKGLLASIFGADEQKKGGKGKKKDAAKKKKVKGGADFDMASKGSMVYNTSDLTSGTRAMYDPAQDQRVASLPYMPQPFSSGNPQTFSPTIFSLTNNDATSVAPSITTGGGKKKRTSHKAKKTSK
jgi:hypothetical protein